MTYKEYMKNTVAMVQLTNQLISENKLPFYQEHTYFGKVMEFYIPKYQALPRIHLCAMRKSYSSLWTLTYSPFRYPANNAMAYEIVNHRILSFMFERIGINYTYLPRCSKEDLHLFTFTPKGESKSKTLSLTASTLKGFTAARLFATIVTLSGLNSQDLFKKFTGTKYFFLGQALNAYMDVFFDLQNFVHFTTPLE